MKIYPGKIYLDDGAYKAVSIENVRLTWWKSFWKWSVIELFWVISDIAIINDTNVDYHWIF